jgi:hypothetical protein
MFENPLKLRSKNLVGSPNLAQSLILHEALRPRIYALTGLQQTWSWQDNL